MRNLGQDLRYALRQLARSPGFSTVAVLTLALGIGANSAIFSVVNGVLLRSLPFEEPDRLVLVYTTYPEDGQTYPLSAPDFMSVHEEGDLFEDAAAFADTRQTLTGRGEPRKVEVGVVSADFFRLMGVRPVLGRDFRPEENREGETGVALLAHGFWQRELGGDPGILGQTLSLNGVAREVVGVLPKGFDFPHGREVYYPLTYGPTFDATTAAGRRSEYLDVVARRAPGVTYERAAPGVKSLSDRLALTFPSTNSIPALATVPLRERLLGDIRTPLLVLLGAVGLVLLIACANVANLLLTRAASRAGEIAVRTALGARTGRLVRQLLTESALLAGLGGVAGLLLAWGGTRLLVAARPEGIPRLETVGVDGTVVLFTAAIALLTGLLFGLLPAIQVTRGDLTAPLKEGGRGRRGRRAGGGRGSPRGALVVVEMALAVMLLIGAGLLIRSFVRLTAVDPGFRPERLISFDLSLPSASYDGDPAVLQFYERLLSRLEALPGASSAAAVSVLPLRGAGNIFAFDIQGRETPADVVQDAVVKSATPEYFRTFGIPLRRGRALSTLDREGAPGAAVVNEAFARRFFPASDAVGARFTFGAPPGAEVPWIEIVGVAGDVRQYGLDRDVRPEIYLSHAQFASSSMSLALRTAAEPGAMAAAIRREVRALDPNLPVEEVTTLARVVGQSVAQPRFYMVLLTIFAAVALVLAAVGVFGIMSHQVAQRRHEIGIRMALGADRTDVLKLVVGQAMLLALGGLALGMFGAWSLSRVLRSLLFETPPTDLLSYVAMPAVLLGVAALAAYLPAGAAARVDPMVTLRQE